MNISKSVLVAAMILPSLATHAQDVRLHPKSEPTCVALARGLWVDVFQKKEPQLSYKYLDQTYIQHDPTMPTGVEWVKYWTEAFSSPAAGPGKYSSDAQRDRVTRIVGISGDDNWAMVEAIDTGTWDNGPHKGKHFRFHYYDLFRCQNGKLVEHWYVPYVPPRSGPNATPVKPVKPR